MTLVMAYQDCLAIVPCDAPSKLFLERIALFRVTDAMPRVELRLVAGREIGTVALPRALVE
jgi:hypothetical protein